MTRYNSTNVWSKYCILLAIGMYFTLYYLPYPVLLFNSFTPWKIVRSPLWLEVMDFRRWLLRSPRPAMPLQEVNYRNLTAERFLSLTDNLAKPLVIRQAWNVNHLRRLSDVNYWSENYGNSTVTCVDVKHEHYRGCSINELFAYHFTGKRNVYSRTNHQILYENPELLEMLSHEIGGWIDDEPLHEIFIGFEESGSPLHAEFTVNFQKQITGRKKWTLVGPSELPFVNLHVTDDGASLLGFTADTVSWSNHPSLQYVNRFETVLEPGDVLFNPTMWMHIVENMRDDSGSFEATDLVIGCPERHFGLKFGWRSSPFLTSHLVLKKVLIKLYQRLNGIKARKTATDLLPIKDAAGARAFDEYIRSRAQELTGAVLQ